MIHDKTIGIARYQDALSAIPESGGGGCHAALLGIANLGVRAGLTPQQIFDDLRSRIHGTRSVPDSEIHDAIRKARAECSASTFVPQAPRQRTNKRTLEKILREGRHGSEADIWKASPIRIDWPPEEDSWRVLSFLYASDEILFCGTGREKAKPGGAIRTAGEWCEYFETGGDIPPHIIPNPLSGEERQTKSGEPSYRSDSCVRSHRFAVVEFDNLDREQQIQFWSAIRLPVAALVDSGGKSIHGWIKVDCDGTETWERDVEQRLFIERLVPLGVDPACRNEARLSRLPGHKRGERWQRVLYLAPEGRPVNG
jgi:hypothetical protein